MSSQLSDTTHEHTKLNIVVACINFVAIAIFIVLGVFYHSKFLRLRYHPFIAKRYPKLVTLFNASILIGFVDRTLWVIIQTGIYYPKWILIFKFILWSICKMSIFFVLMVRVYLVFFNVKWAKANDNNRWQCYINKNEQSNTSWFIKNHATYGSIYYISKRFAIAYVICFSIPILIYLISGYYYAVLVDFIIDVILTCIIVILWLKIPVFHDQFLIRREIRLMFYVFSVLIVNYLIYLILGFIIGSRFATFAVSSGFSIVGFGLTSLITTCFAMRSYEQMRMKSKTNNNNHDYDASVTITTIGLSDNDSFRPNGRMKIDDLSKTTSISRNDNSAYIINVTIIDFISEEFGFNAFMNHLSKEFSMENLLAIVEFTQFKMRYKQIESILNNKNSTSDIHGSPGNIAIQSMKSMSRLKNAVRNNVLKLNLSLSAATSHSQSDHNVNSSPNSPISPNSPNSPPIEVDIGMTALQISPYSLLDNDSKNNDNDADGGGDGNQWPLPRNSMLNKYKSVLDVRSDIMKLPDKLPKSSIVFGGENSNCLSDLETDIAYICGDSFDKNVECKRIITELYEKYIFVGSDLELNLSHRLRQKCIKKFDNQSELFDAYLFHIFDKCIVALLKLMEDSYLRFKATEEYRHFEVLIKKRISINE